MAVVVRQVSPAPDDGATAGVSGLASDEERLFISARALRDGRVLSNPIMRDGKRWSK